MQEILFDVPPRVTLIRHQGPPIVIEELESLSTNRLMSEPVAQAEITLLGQEISGRPAEDILNLWDMIRIEWYGRDQKWHEDGVYLVDFPRTRDANLANGEEQGYQISLVSIGESLLRYTIMFHDWLVKRSNIAGLGFQALANGRPIRGLPHEVIPQLYNAFINDDYVWRAADGRKLNQIFDLEIENAKNALAQVANFNSLGEASLWDTLKAYSDQPWHELFVSPPYENSGRQTTFGSRSALTIEDQLANSGVKKFSERIYFRPTPFDPEDWRELYNRKSWGFDYDGSDLFGEFAPGPKSIDVNNFFMATGSAKHSSVNMIAEIRNIANQRIPRYDVSSIQRYGFRKVEVPSIYIDIPARDRILQKNNLSPGDSKRAGSSTLADMLVAKTKQLHLWFGYPYYSGVLPTVGRIGPDKKYGARIGGIIHNQNTGREYYIVGLGQNWNRETLHTTNMILEKGHIPRNRSEWWNQRKDSPVYQGQERRDGVGSL